MIFKDENDSIVRIPDDKLGGVLFKDGGACLWGIGDLDDDGTAPMYKVSQDTFIKCMSALGDTEVE